MVIRPRPTLVAEQAAVAAAEKAMNRLLSVETALLKDRKNATMATMITSKWRINHILESTKTGILCDFSSVTPVATTVS